MKTLHYIGLILLVLALSSWNLKKDLKGSGNSLKEQRETTPFEGIDVNNAIHVFLTHGNEESVEVEADDNIVPYIQTKVRDRILHITLKGDEIRSFSPKLPMNVYVTIKDLQEVKAHAASSVEGKSVFKTEKLELDICSAATLELEIQAGIVELDVSSAANVTLTGTADKIKADLSGASRWDGSELETLKTDIDMSGASTATVKVKDELQYDVSSASRLVYSGDPRIYKAEVSGAGSVKKK